MDIARSKALGASAADMSGVGIGTGIRTHHAITNVRRPPVNGTAPSVSGGAVVGSVLSVTTGTWSGDPTIAFTYQWTRDGAGIGGANGSTYASVSADVGHAVGSSVTGTNGSGSATAASNTVTVTQAPVNTAAPVVSGLAPVGSVLSVTTGTWSGFPAPAITYQWRRGGVAIGGATASTYTTVSADVTQAVSCDDTATNSAGSATQGSSNSVTVTQAPVNTAAPVASSTNFQVGDTLSVTDGTWSGFPAPAITYQWRRGGVAIGGATANTYVATASDVGTTIDCLDTATNSAGSASQASNGLLSALLYVADFTTQSAGAGSLSSYGLTLTRTGAGATVQTAAGAIASGIAVDTPRFYSDGTRTGLLVEKSIANAWPTSNNQSGDSTFGSPTVTQDETGVDGSTKAYRAQASSGGGIFRTLSGQTNGAKYTWSAWLKRKSGLGNGSYTLRISTPDTNINGTIGDSTWVRKAITITLSVANPTCYPLDTRILSAALDYEVDWTQLEQSGFATSPYPTSGAAATRGADHLSYASGSALLTSGRIGIEAKFNPLGASTAYTVNPRLWTIDANNYAEIDATTRAVNISVGGTVYSTAGTMTWAALDTVEVWCEAGGGSLATVVKYRVNGGSVTTLSTGSPPTQAALSVSGALDLLCNGTSNQCSAVHQRVAFYRSGTKPSWA